MAAVTAAAPAYAKKSKSKELQKIFLASKSSRMIGEEIHLATLPTLKISELRALYKERNIVLGVSAKKEDLEKALKAREEAMRAQSPLGNEITPESDDDVEDNNDPFTEGDQESVVPTVCSRNNSLFGSDRSFTSVRSPKDIEA
ncbi:hypothetical protein NDU88_001875 [Pleurodeles waltl]|uniref:Uncharacterized protein n=1 Tax=Pleurodeles waltl TaxID=8319 RepID=A0AAV7KSM1_PLEWA|nr:hypothetical protein NDU88_001875 [Pleurodeles waltl]